LAVLVVSGAESSSQPVGQQRPPSGSPRLGALFEDENGDGGNTNGGGASRETKDDDESSIRGSVAGSVAGSTIASQAGGGNTGAAGGAHGTDIVSGVCIWRADSRKLLASRHFPCRISCITFCPMDSNLLCATGTSYPSPFDVIYVSIF
jgi:hypothetical protein